MPEKGKLSETYLSRERCDAILDYVRSRIEEGDSFATVVGTVDRLLGATRVYLRINVDPGIGRSALSLVDFFADRGWLEPDSHVYPYLASIGPMTEHCGFIGTSQRFQNGVELPVLVMLGSGAAV